MTNLISRLRALSRHEHDDLTIGDEAADEIERLTACLKKANDQAEHFEREWYLRGDEIVRLRQQHAQAMADMDAEIDRLRAALRNLLDMDVAYMRGPKVEEAVEAALAALKEKLND